MLVESSAMLLCMSMMPWRGQMYGTHENTFRLSHDLQGLPECCKRRIDLGRMALLHPEYSRSLQTCIGWAFFWHVELLQYLACCKLLTMREILA